MEDMARLAVVEQSVRDGDKFNELLFELLGHISHILENPLDYELRTLESDILIDEFKHDSFRDYLKYVGFKLEGSKCIYPLELPLNNLRMAQAAIERKISFCYGNTPLKRPQKSNQKKVKKVELTPSKILKTNNTFLLKVEDLFNQVLEYENEELQALAREQIPLVTLQLMALDRVREQQKKIKSGEIKDQDLSFDVALIMELLGWFKYKFFSWVDCPECQDCKGPTVWKKTEMATIDGERCKVEVYACNACGGGARFPRYSNVRTLLRTRRGRCGEWANCFALLCRALAYDTRYVYDVTDHVWCEIYDYDSKTWLHADPCEAKLNTPLMYEYGWGKKLSYVIAVSRDDLQDVTWRYSLNHKETLGRRTLCSERELVQCIMSLRGERQRALSGARCQMLARRAVLELVQLMHERKPTDYESHGRISGSRQWRSERQEVGQGHTFEFTLPGPCVVRYHAGTDKYWISEAGKESCSIDSWIAGVYRSEKMFRKVEDDWKMVYLAREEGEDEGFVTWRFEAKGELRFTDLRLNINTAVYDSGNVSWTVQYNQNDPQPILMHEGSLSLEPCVSVAVRASVRGGSGAVAWQHAQLCRASLADQNCALEFHAILA